MSSIEILTDRVGRLACRNCGETMLTGDQEPFTDFECPFCGKHQPVPAKLGSFLLLAELGKGAMGAVYKGYDATLKRLVAIKVMQQKYGSDKEFVEKFLGEARALAALNHPNVAQIYSCGQEKGQLYIVMELVPGGRADKVFKEKGPLKEDYALQLLHDAARGLKAASEIGLVHGDVKPENLLFDKDGTAKVVDFGIARFQGDKVDSNDIWGTPFYIAPEILERRPPDLKSDIYSLGATMFHLLAGHPPFDGKTTKDVLINRLKGPAPSLADIRSDLKPATCDLIARMLERDPFRRYPNYASLLADIEEAQQATTEKKTSHSHNGHHHKRKKSNSAHWISVLIALAVAGAIAVVFTLRSKDQKPSKPTKSAKQQPGVVTRRTTSSKTVTTKSKTIARKTKPSSTQPKRSGPLELTSRQGRGSDAFIQGPGGSKSKHRDTFGAEEFIWIKAGKQKSLHLCRKAYIKMDLSAAQGPWQKARLELTADKSGSNRNSDEYTLTLWGLTADAPDWRESLDLDTEILPINWDNAPGNDLSEPSDMDSRQAIALMTLPVEANPAVGSMIVFDSTEKDGQKLLDYINRHSGETVTFMLTADNKVAQRAGWKFASREHPFLAPPTLKLEP